MSVPTYLILEAQLKSLKIWLNVFKMASEAKALSFLHLFRHTGSNTDNAVVTKTGVFFSIRKIRGTELATFLTGSGKNLSSLESIRGKLCCSYGSSNAFTTLTGIPSYFDHS